METQRRFRPSHLKEGFEVRQSGSGFRESEQGGKLPSNIRHRIGV
jgi:hypothetical protein